MKQRTLRCAPDLFQFLASSGDIGVLRRDVDRQFVHMRDPSASLPEIYRESVDVATGRGLQLVAVVSIAVHVEGYWVFLGICEPKENKAGWSAFLAPLKGRASMAFS
jgi:hypothetical protein